MLEYRPTEPIGCHRHCKCTTPSQPCHGACQEGLGNPHVRVRPRCLPSRRAPRRSNIIVCLKCGSLSYFEMPGNYTRHTNNYLNQGGEGRTPLAWCFGYGVEVLFKVNTANACGLRFTHTPVTRRQLCPSFAVVSDGITCDPPRHGPTPLPVPLSPGKERKGASAPDPSCGRYGVNLTRDVIREL